MRYLKTLEGKTVNLRSIEERDAQATFELRSIPDKTRFIHAATGNVEDQLNYIRNQQKKPGDWLFVIEDKQGAIIGMKGVYGYDSEARTAETGRFLSVGSQIQSVEALMLGFDFAFEVLDVVQVEMSALEENTNMRGMQRRFGAEETYSEYDREFGCKLVHSILTRARFAETRPRIERLVLRFAGRDNEVVK